ncbi:hypothetical protein K439DRAFT_1631925 [Ramaria rubella]|nr:hypothetical protein K439DRAFT_1631925 [Ramaria rubella]
MFHVLQEGRDDYPTWFKISDGVGTAADFDALFKDCHAVLDQPPAYFAAELLSAYPNAKFILTTRDPAKWEKSMRATLLPAVETILTKIIKSPIEESLAKWDQDYLLTKWHRGRLFSHTQQEILDHNEHVKRIIPAERLLVYEIGEGWDKLVRFLEVSKPDVAFPHLNDTLQFQAVVKGFALGTGTLQFPNAAVE